MKAKSSDVIIQKRSKNILRIFLIICLILFIPLIAMQFTDQIKWTFADFATAGALLFSAGLVYEFVIKRIRGRKNKLIASGTLVIVVLLLWLELSVGLFTGWGD